MPTTVNGIGTHYYGKKNQSTRSDVCRHCRRLAVLDSYDTRLWFVLVFIPVIPLGRKRVIDSCSLCRMHVALDADSYEQSRQKQVSEALTRFRDAPSPELALAAHATLLAFHDGEKAAGLRRESLVRFPGQISLLEGFASHLDNLSARDEALPFHEAALKVDRDLPAARVGVALARMEEGRLDDARALLAFLLAPGSERKHSLHPLRTLAEHFQQQGRHAEALEIARHLLRENPALGEQHAFRSFVKKSENSQGALDSILPPRTPSLLGLFGLRGTAGYAPWQRWTALAGTAAVLVALSLAGSNEYVRRNRSIYVVNACGGDLGVHIDDEPVRTISGLGRFVVGEGHHRIRFSGAIEETQDVALQTPYLDRWLNKPVWALNPGNEAVLRESTIHYAKNPPPPESRFIVGQPFLYRPHVDYAFEDLPESLKLFSGQSEIAKTSLQWHHGEEAHVFRTLLKDDRPAAIAFAERRLRRNPALKELLDAYLDLAMPAELPQIQNFLEAGLGRRPVVVPWHRAYQSLSEFRGESSELFALYDKFLKAEPANGPLLYLRGRVEPDWEKQASFYRRASQAAPRLPWPWLALGTRAEAGANWDEALRCLLKAHDLAIDPDQIREPLQLAQLGAGGAEALVAELRIQVSSQPSDVRAILALTEALAAAGKPGTIDAEINAWQNRALPAVPAEVIAQVRAIGFYHAGRVKDCADRCVSLTSLRVSSLRAHSLLALERVNEVISEASFKRILADPRMALCLSLALYLEHQPGEAARWREHAIAGLKNAYRDLRRAAEILGAPGPTAVAEFDRLLIDPDLKALIFALLAERHPAMRAEYLAASKRFNVRRKPPFQLVRLAIDRAQARPH
jgi:tetratricopeptide (TPR) repeat protein